MCLKIKMYYIEVAVKKKNDQPLTITFSKEDMLKVPSDRKSELNNDHGNYKENKDNDDSGGSKTERSKENEDVTVPLLPKDTNSKSSTPGTKNAVHTQTQAHAAYGIAEEIEIPSMDTSGTKKEVMSTILDAVRNLSRGNRRHPRITFLDFGGQSMYYAFHQIYLSPKTFYILVLDMSKSLDEKVHVTEDTCGGQFESWTYKGMLLDLYNVLDQIYTFVFVFPWTDISHFHWFKQRGCLIYFYVISVRVNFRQHGCVWSTLCKLLSTFRII